jgi:hypothetical protein
VLSHYAHTALYSSGFAAHSAASSVLALYGTPAQLVSSVERDQVLQRVAALKLNTELSTVADLFIACSMYVIHSCSWRYDEDGEIGHVGAGTDCHSWRS